MTENDVLAMTVPELRAQCKARGLDHTGNRAELQARLIQELREIAAWEEKKANPTLYEQGHRIILDNGTEIPLRVMAYFPDHGRMRKEWVRVEYPNPDFPDDPMDHTSATTAEKALTNARTNIGANFLIAEYLRPGQKSRAELGLT